ncbi:MAG: hypothetical protein E7384_01645 [Ruminococcaceae bacterium]|nr:hypothetical protein [Oscillospiraceae bacterium]
MKEGSINFYFLLNILLKNIVWLVLAAILGGVVMYGYSSNTAITTYTSSLKLLVRNFSIRDGAGNPFVDSEDGEDSDKEKQDYSYIISTSAISASKSLIETYMVIIKTEDSLKMVVDDIKANAGYTDELTYKPVEDDEIFTDDDWYKHMGTWEVGASIYMAPVGETEVFQVNVTTTDYRKTEAISKAIKNQIQAIINENYDVGSVHVIESPHAPYRSTPTYMSKVLIGAVAGFALVAVAFFIAAYVDNTVKCEADIKESMGVLPLGEIPDLIDVRKTSYRYYHYKNSKYSYKEKEE